MLHYTFSLISEKTSHIHSHEYLCRATASINDDFQNVLQYSIRRKKRDCQGHSHEYLCRATASISVDFQNVLQYSIRRKKRDCLRHSHECLCRATASISVDFQNVLHYSIRRKKRETARGTLFFFLVLLSGFEPELMVPKTIVLSITP